MEADLALFHAINGFAGRWPAIDALMIGVARGAPILFAVVLLGCWVTWRPEWQRSAGVAGVAALAGLGAGQIVGMLLPRPRPYLATAANVLVIHGVDTSFPSDHAIMAFAVTTVLATRSMRLARWLVAFSLLLLVARVFVGVHYPADVIGGAALGALSGWTATRVARVPRVARWIDSVFALLARLRLAAASVPLDGERV